MGCSSRVTVPILKTFLASIASISFQIACLLSIIARRQPLAIEVEQPLGLG